MLTLPSSVKIFIYTQPADMRSGFHRLSMLAESFMLKDPLSGHLFVFFVMTTAAAEVAVGLALIVAIFKAKRTIDLDQMSSLKG